MITFNTRNFRKALKEALDLAENGKRVLIVRNGTIFVMKLFEGEGDERKSNL